MVIDVVMALFLLNPVFAQETVKCVSVANKFLSSNNFGTFSDLRRGVSKDLLKDGTFVFDVVGGKKITFNGEKHELTVASFENGVLTSFRARFSDNCEITFFGGGSQGPYGEMTSMFGEANPEKCKEIRLKSLTAPSPAYSWREQIVHTWCNEYFPDPKAATKGSGAEANGRHWMPGLPVGPGSPNWKSKNTDN